MLKILNCYKWLEDLGENTKEIDECLEKGLIKYASDESEPYFIMLESNTNKVKEILKNDYDLLDEMTFLEWLPFQFDAFTDLEIKNIFNNKITVSMATIIDLIKDEEEIYFPNEKKLAIYNDSFPNDKTFEFLNEIGREQARLQVRDLLNSITDQEFR